MNKDKQLQEILDNLPNNEHLILRMLESLRVDVETIKYIKKSKLKLIKGGKQ